MSINCPVCSQKNTRERDLRLPNETILEISCLRCGTFKASPNFLDRPTDLTDREVAKISGWIFEHPYEVLTSVDWSHLRGLPELGVGLKAEKLLSYLAKKYPIPNQPLSFTGSVDELACCYASNQSEANYLFDKYLANYKKFIAKPDGQGGYNTTISPAGWDFINSLSTKNKESEIGFCAMWFEPKMMPVWTDCIAPAIRSAGYRPERIDQHHHNNRIDDEIIAMIRKSKFVVADFTGGRGGVYFEAGYALGFGLPVVWTVRECELKDIHFDARQYSFIQWEYDKLPEFHKALVDRIEATIGRGPRHEYKNATMQD